MSLLSPRFLPLPLIALTVILMLPRQPASADAAPRIGVVKAATCGSLSAPATCMLAGSQNSVVR